MNDLLEPLCGYYASMDFYYRARDLYAANSLGFYDALIIQAALDLGCDVLYSEDLQNSQQFGKLTIINPFIQDNLILAEQTR